MEKDSVPFRAPLLVPGDEDCDLAYQPHHARGFGLILPSAPAALSGRGDVEGPERRFLKAESLEHSASFCLEFQVSWSHAQAGPGRKVRWGIPPEAGYRVPTFRRSNLQLGAWPRVVYVPALNTRMKAPVSGKGCVSNLPFARLPLISSLFHPYSHGDNC